MVWTLRLALRLANQGTIQGKVTLIDADSLPRKAVYNMRYFHAQMKKKRVFTDGTWHYGGVHELYVLTQCADGGR